MKSPTEVVSAVRESVAETSVAARAKVDAAKAAATQDGQLVDKSTYDARVAQRDDLQEQISKAQAEKSYAQPGGGRL